MMRLQAALGIAGLIWFAGGVAQAQSEPAAPLPPPSRVTAQPDKGVTVLGRGPLHESFAQPANSDPRPTPIIPRQPPAPVPEQPPAEKPADPSAEWIPGYWQWDVARKDFDWVSGVWRVPPPGKQWVPGYWHQASTGYQWVPGLWTAAGQQSIPYDSSPPPSLEIGPSAPAPDQDHFYVPGCWLDRDSGYAWRPGYWTTGYDNWVWQPSHYTWTPAGCVFVPGYWDRPLEDRGLLFAPVAFDQPLWQQAGWSFTPSYVIDPTALLDCLFYQPGWDNYCFGDYYNPFFSQTCGFRPWWGYGRGFYDPLFSYYGWRHRFDRGWGAGLRNHYYARLGGRLAGPAATLAGQRTLARANRGGERFASAGVLRPLSRTAGLRRLDAAQVRTHFEASRRYGRLGQTRSRTEAASRVRAGGARAASYQIRQPGFTGSRYAGYFGRGVGPLTPMDHFGRSSAWESRGRPSVTRSDATGPGRSIRYQSLAAPRSTSRGPAVPSDWGRRSSSPPRASASPPSFSRSTPRLGFDAGRSAGSIHRDTRPSWGGHSGGSHSSGGHSGGHSGSSHSSGGHSSGHHR